MTSKTMRNLIKYILCARLLFVMPIFASAKQVNAVALFKQGNAAYAKNQYKEAALAYQQVLDAGYESASLHFNLGNARYKLAEMPEAILNYEKALKLNPGDADIRLNLQLANLKITDKIDTLPDFFLTRWWKELVFLLSLRTLSILAVIFALTGFVLLIAYLFLIAVWPKKTAFYAGLTVLIFALLFLILASIQSQYLNGNRHGIVFTGAADVKSGPDVRQKTLFLIHEGTKVNIQERESDWVKIVLANGNGGWIRWADIREI